MGSSTKSWPSQPAIDASLVTPSDTEDLSATARALYIGTTGNVRLTTVSGRVVTFATVPVGILPVGAQRVWSTGTTASNIVALW